MDWITSEIAIGDYREAQDCSLLRQQGINSILGLISTLRGKSAEEMRVSRIDVGNPGRTCDASCARAGSLPRWLEPLSGGCRSVPHAIAAKLSAADAMTLVAAQLKIWIAPELRVLIETA